MNTLQSNSITQSDIDDVNVQSFQPLVPPAQLKAELPLNEKAYQTVLNGRETVRQILDGQDKRLFVVIGPCSIHDIEAAHDYADRLKVLAEKVPTGLLFLPSVAGISHSPLEFTREIDIAKGLTVLEQTLKNLSKI